MKIILIIILNFNFIFAQFLPKPFGQKHDNWHFLPELSDEFEMNTLDTSKWNLQINSWGKWSWDPKNVFLNNGMLFIKFKFNPHQRHNNNIFYTSGIIKSRKRILYGYFEIKMKAMKRYPGVCPAFWLSNHQPDKWTEIDIVELTQSPKSPKIIHLNTHVFKYPYLILRFVELHENYTWKAEWDPRNDFHIYACEWGPDSLKWFIDGQMIRIRKNKYWDQPLNVIISAGLRPPLTNNPDTKEFPDSLAVDYIRVWQSNSW